MHPHTTIAREMPAIDNAIRIAAAGFGRTVTAELEADVQKHLAGGDLVYSLYNTPGLCGFAIFNVLALPAGSRLLYLSGIILDPKHQRRGQAELAIRQAQTDAAEELGTAPGYLGLRTASVWMWRAGQKVCGPDHWAPHPERLLAAHLAPAAQTVAKHLGCPSAPVCLDCYPEPLYGTPPIHPQFSPWWDGLRHARQHPRTAVICVGQLPPL